MIEYVDAEVPFVTVGNRRAITDLAIVENPWVLEFMAAFKKCFERDDIRRCWWFYAD
jgi:hypothetical protein